MKKTDKIGYLFVLLSALCLSIFPMVSIYLFKDNMNPSSIQFLRYTFALLFLGLFIFASKQSIRISKMDLLYTFIMGGVCATCISVTYLWSMKYIHPALSAFILYIYPVPVYLYEMLFNNEKFSKKIFYSILLSLIGLFLILGINKIDINIYGIMLAFTAMIAYVIYVLVASKLSNNLSSLVSCTYINLFTSIGLLFICLIFNNYKIDYSVEIIGFTAISGLLFTAVPILLFLYSLRLISATKASILSTSDTFYTLLFSCFILGKNLSIIQTIGCFVLLSGIVFLIWNREKKSGK